MDTDLPNILLMVMDTARADRASDPEVMPNIERIASEGKQFTNAFSTAPWTLPSHGSIFTGQYPSDHGAHAGTKRFRPDSPVLAEQLNDNGYQTVGISNNTWVSSEFGFDRGFEEFYVGWELVQGGADLPTIAKSHQGMVSQARAISRELLSTEAPKTLINAAYTKLLRKHYDNGARVTNWRIDRWLSSKRDNQRPFFMFVNYLEPHLEYDPPKRFREQFFSKDINLRTPDRVNQDPWAYVCGEIEMDNQDFDTLSALYNAELAYLDYRIGEVYDTLKERDLLSNTVILIVADHGENIGDHGLMDHQYCLYDTLIHVPLIIRCPQRLELETKEESLVELRDLYPTILDVIGANQPEDERVSDQSLLNKVNREHVIGEYLAPQPSINTLFERIDEASAEIEQYDRALRSLRTTEWKYIEGTDGSEELYNINVDPEETTNVANDYPHICADLAERLATIRGELSRGDRNELTTKIDTGTQQRLEDLGYL